MDDTNDEVSVFESPDTEQPEKRKQPMEGKPMCDLKSFGSHSTRGSLGSSSKRLESEEFENISVSCLEDLKAGEEDSVKNDDHASKASAREIDRKNTDCSSDSKLSKTYQPVGRVGKSLESIHVEGLKDIIEEDIQESEDIQRRELLGESFESAVDDKVCTLTRGSI